MCVWVVGGGGGGGLVLNLVLQPTAKELKHEKYKGFSNVHVRDLVLESPKTAAGNKQIDKRLEYYFSGAVTNDISISSGALLSTLL